MMQIFLKSYSADQKSHLFYQTQKFITMFKKVHCGRYPELAILIQFIPCKIYFNIILQYVIRSLKYFLTLRFSLVY
jgi:hypothetical protein